LKKMGCGTSKYVITVAECAVHPSLTSWIAEASCKLVPIKNECFKPTTPIGKGKFGIVYLSKHESCNKYVAIKFIPMKIIHECNCVTRLQQEIDILQRIDHPFVAHCFGGFSTSGSIALVFEYAYGGELYTRMKQSSSMPEMHAKFYLAEIACALDYLHNTLNIVYRDLKPENILIDVHGHVKLCDFGFAVPLGRGDGDGGDGLKDTVGTAMYVAPEIAGGRRGGDSFSAS
jgi:serine/threonine protein kinase